MNTKLPGNKKEGIAYSLLMCTLMVFFMSIFNVCIGYGDVSLDIFLLAIESMPLCFIFALFIESILISKIASWAAFKFVSFEDSDNSKIMFIGFFMITGMSFVMTFFALIRFNGISNNLLDLFTVTWPRNFLLAMFLQFGFVGLVSRRILAVLFNNHNKFENEQVVNI